MAIYKIKKIVDFTTMSNQHFKEKQLSYKAKGLLSTMLSLPDDWEYSIQGLVSLSTDGEASVRAGLQELEELGYLERVRTRKEGKLDGIEYNIYEIPKSDFLKLENLKQENPGQLKHILSKDNIFTNNIKQTVSKDTVLTKSIDENENQKFSSTKRTPKQEKNLEKISLKLSEYTFSENIEELILRFYSDKIECGQFIPDNQLEAQLTRLAQESEDQQLIAINRAIEGGWKNITAYFNNDFNKPEVPGYHIHRDGDQNHWQHPQHNGAKEKAEKYGVKF